MEFKLSLTVDGLTDIGNRRKNNEDAWWAGQLGGEHCFMAPGADALRLVTTAGPALLMVCDGVGGANAGEVASQMAITLVTEDLARGAAELAHANAARDRLLAAIKSADAAITAKSVEPGFDGMGATLSLLCFSSAGVAFWGQAGDSRIYICRGGKLRQISHDHSPVGRMKQRGEITEAEARKHPLRNQIDQSLGNNESSFQPETGVEQVMPGDVFLLCSDGLSDGLWDHEIEKLVAGVRVSADVRPTAEQLIASAKQASGRDNITAVVALLENVEPIKAVKAPAAPDAKPAFWQRWFRGSA
jgi:serine/threonine protein phosphatase PrpC